MMQNNRNKEQLFVWITMVHFMMVDLMEYLDTIHRHSRHGQLLPLFQPLQQSHEGVRGALWTADHIHGGAR